MKNRSDFIDKLIEKICKKKAINLFYFKTWILRLLLRERKKTLIRIIQPRDSLKVKLLLMIYTPLLRLKLCIIQDWYVG